MAKGKGQKNKVSSAAGWKGKKKGGPVPLELPSGNTCLCKPIGVKAMLTMGMVPNSLMTIVTNALEKKDEALDEAEIAELVRKDPQKLTDVFLFADAVVVHCVIEPKVLPVLQDGEEIDYEDRDSDGLYIDEVDEQDKMFIMNFAMGGNREVEPFRERLAEGVESVSDEPDDS